MAPANHRLMQQTPLQHHLPSPDASFSAGSVPSTAPPSPPRSTSSCSTAVTVLPASLLPISQPRLDPRRGRSRSASNLPESVFTAFQYIQEAHHGRYVGPSWVSFPNVSSDDLEALVSAATREGIHKYRYDFDPLLELLTLRMPEGKPHNFTKNGIGCSIRDHLHRRLDQAIEDEDNEYKADALRSIKQLVSLNTEAEVKLPTGAIKVPDVSFFHEGQAYPPLVVEIGSSQKSAELPRLAREYIGQTGGKIQTVITVHIGYDKPTQRSAKRRRHRSLSNQDYTGRVTRSRSRSRQSQTTSRSRSRGQGLQASAVDDPDTQALASSSARVSLFRLQDQVMDNQLFRDDEGACVDGSLELNVADFVPRDDTFKSLSFNVPFKELYNALERGEKQQRLEEQTPPPEEQGTSRKRVHFEFKWELSQPESGSASTRELRPSSKRRRNEASTQVALRRRRSQ